MTLYDKRIDITNKCLWPERRYHNDGAIIFLPNGVAEITRKIEEIITLMSLEYEEVLSFQNLALKEEIIFTTGGGVMKKIGSQIFLMKNRGDTI